MLTRSRFLTEAMRDLNSNFIRKERSTSRSLDRFWTFRLPSRKARHSLTKRTFSIPFLSYMPISLKIVRLFVAQVVYVELANVDLMTVRAPLGHHKCIREGVFITIRVGYRPMNDLQETDEHH